MEWCLEFNVYLFNRLWHSKSIWKNDKYFNWYNSFFPITFTPKDKAIEILNSGFYNCYGRDHEFKPILIVQPYIYQTKLKNHSPNDLMRASIFLCEYVKNNLLIPGQIENWNMIVNLKGTSITSIPYSKSYFLFIR